MVVLLVPKLSSLNIRNHFHFYMQRTFCKRWPIMYVASLTLKIIQWNLHGVYIVLGRLSILVLLVTVHLK